MSRFPLCDAAGLSGYNNAALPGNLTVVPAADVEKFFGKGIRVFQHPDHWANDWCSESDSPPHVIAEASCTGLVVMIEPVKKDTAADLLKEITEELSAAYLEHHINKRLKNIAERARLLLRANHE